MTKTLESPKVVFVCYCLDCKKRHHVECDPGMAIFQEEQRWRYRHAGHRVEFSTPGRLVPRDATDEAVMTLGRFADFAWNNNFQLAFQAAANLTITSLNSLASDPNLVAGASSTVVDNGATLAPLQIGVTAFVKNNTGVAPTAGKEIDLWAWARIDDTTYPDAVTGTDSATTITTTNILQSGFRQLASLIVAATTSQINPMAPVELGGLFGFMPRFWGVFVVHNSGQSIAASGNQVTQKGLYVAG